MSKCGREKDGEMSTFVLLVISPNTGEIALTDVDVPNVRGRSLLAQVNQGGSTRLSTGEDRDELYGRKKRIDNGDSQRHEISILWSWPALTKGPVPPDQETWFG